MADKSSQYRQERKRNGHAAAKTLKTSKAMKERQNFQLLLLCLLGSFAFVDGYIAPFFDDGTDEPRCVGLQADFSKLKDIETEDLEEIQNPTGSRRFEITSVQRITRHDGTGALRDRVRLREHIDGVEIHGASVVVNFKGCNSFICGREVESLTGKTFRDVNVTSGYETTFTEEEVYGKISKLFGADDDGIGDLSLKVFSSTAGDHLAYFTDVLIEKQDFMRYFSIIVDAHDLSVLSICNLVGPYSEDIKRENQDSGQGSKPGKGGKTGGRRLKNNEPPPVSVNGISCGSCSDDSDDVTWSSTQSECPINSLYLNDAGRTTTCVVGTNSLGQTVLGTGPVPSLHWGGTQDCKSSTDKCSTRIIPQCSDAISDVQYGAIKTLEYFQQYLGVMGGLKESADEPQPIRALVHYSKQYCNAFYRYSANTVFFGDCDCSYWTPLTSVDIIAHEISHGVTRHSSGLEYEYQSGGMNEAFSDIVGAVVEFLVNDSIDTPDFDIGESLGLKLRSMENPTEAGRSIDSVCSYKSNMDVHHTSGPLNKAYVNAVRACEQSGCGDLASCTVLIGTVFMYSNIQLLTTYSGYLDGARASCSIVGEYFEAKSPQTMCSSDSIVTFIRQGWATVNVALNEKCEAQTCCSAACPAVGDAPQFPTPSPTTGPPTTPHPTLPPNLQPPPNTGDPEEDEGNIIVRIFRAIFDIFGTLFGRD